MSMSSAETKPGHFHYAKDPTGLTKALIILLWSSLGLLLISIVSDLMEMRLLSSEAFTHEEAVANDNRQMAVGILGLLAYVVTGITFLMWIYRANLNCHGFGAQFMEFTPGWAIGYYFIPVANLFKPFQAMKEIWKVSGSPLNWKLEKDNSLLGWWWGLWIISGFLGQITFRLSWGAETLAELQSAVKIGIIASAIDVPLYLVAISLVGELSKKQETLVNPYASLPETAV